MSSSSSAETTSSWDWSPWSEVLVPGSRSLVGSLRSLYSRSAPGLPSRDRLLISSSSWAEAETTSSWDWSPWFEVPAPGEVALGSRLRPLYSRSGPGLPSNDQLLIPSSSWAEAETTSSWDWSPWFEVPAQEGEGFGSIQRYCGEAAWSGVLALGAWGLGRSPYRGPGAWSGVLALGAWGLGRSPYRGTGAWSGDLAPGAGGLGRRLGYRGPADLGPSS